MTPCAVYCCWCLISCCLLLLVSRRLASGSILCWLPDPLFSPILDFYLVLGNMLVKGPSICYSSFLSWFLS